jgi:hypothetical protein
MIIKKKKSKIRNFKVLNINFGPQHPAAHGVLRVLLELKGEIITTPFTWVATLSAIQWEGCTPIFCDIDPETLNIDPSKIEEKITEKTVAILPVHVFGNPCNVDAIDKIAKNEEFAISKPIKADIIDKANGDYRQIIMLLFSYYHNLKFIRQILR